MNAETSNETVVDRVAKAIADVVGHGMAEKCEAQARAAIAAPAPPPAAARGDVRGLVGDLHEIARLVGTIFFAGDFKAETFNERELEALLVKRGYRYTSWDEVHAAALAAEGVQAGEVGCDCPGKGKDDPALHAPNCPARLSQQPEARGVVDEDEVFRLAAGSHYGAEPNSYWDMDRDALLAFARALTGERNG